MYDFIKREEGHIPFEEVAESIRKHIADHNWKSVQEVYRLKHHLNDIGINYLLNIGPDGLGRIPGPCSDILRGVAEMEK